MSSAGVELAVHERGDRSRPTVVLVHGYPDTSAVWDEIVSRLEHRFHVVAYDVRGAGSSSAPSGRHGYVLDRLVDDLAAVIDAVSPDRPIHLVGHDWGSVQSWEAVTSERFAGTSEGFAGTSDRLAGRIASFTSISGPGLDHVGHWVQARLRAPRPRGLAQLVAQGARSWYVGFFHVPVLPKLGWRLLAKRWPAILARAEGLPARNGHPASTLAADARRGIALYRQNVLERLRHPNVRRTTIPVQLVVPTGDAYLSPALYADLDQWVDRWWRRDIRASHWVQRSHPDELARWITELVDHIEGAVPSRSLRRARVGVERRRFEDKLVVVTGAGSGIGRATALAFAEHGAEVVAADIDAAAAARTAELAGGFGLPAHALEVDVSDADAMDRFAKTIEHDHGVPDIVVNNAGIGIAGSFLATDVADWQRVLDVNLWGVIHGARLFGAQMVRRREGGHIVNIASAAAFLPSRTLPAYSTSKAAVLMLSECLRAELAEHGIGVTAVCPGLVDTNITRSTRFVGVSDDDQERHRRAAARFYRRRNFPPDRVADAILRAVETNAAVVPVTAEAKLARAIQRLWPAAARRFARIDSTPR